MEQFNIIDWLSGLTAFVFDKQTLINVARKRGALNISEYEDLEDRQRDLMYADLLFVIYTSPNKTASHTNQHGSFLTTTGSQTIDKQDSIYNVMMFYYRKWDDEIVEILEEDSGGINIIGLNEY